MSLRRAGRAYGLSKCAGLPKVHDQEPYDFDDDERFHEETAYNEEYYIEQERELIRQSNPRRGSILQTHQLRANRNIQRRRPG